MIFALSFALTRVICFSRNFRFGCREKLWHVNGVSTKNEESSTVSRLDFLSANKQRFNLLIPLAKQALVIPDTSPQVKKVFVTESLIMRPHRPRMSAPDGRCFPVARSVTLSTLFNLADRNRICLNGGTPNDVQAGQWQTSFSGRGDAHLRRTVNKFQRPSILQLNIEGLTASKMSVLHHLALV